MDVKQNLERQLLDARFGGVRIYMDVKLVWCLLVSFRSFEGVRIYMDVKQHSSAGSCGRVLEVFEFTWMSNGKAQIPVRSSVLEVFEFTWMSNRIVCNISCLCVLEMFEFTWMSNGVCAGIGDIPCFGDM